MKKLVGLLIFALSLIANSCSSDHDHFTGYEYDDYNAHYHYYNGYYYYDDQYYVYEHDYNHYYYGRLEWKGSYWAVVLRENPYYGLVCAISNDGILPTQLGHHNVYDHEVMVKFAFTGYDGGKNWIRVDHIYYR